MSNRESPHFSRLHGTQINVITFLGDITILRSDKFFQSYPEDVVLSWGSGGSALSCELVVASQTPESLLVGLKIN